MPNCPRMGKGSCSRICVTSLPNTVMRPESGRKRPSASFRIVLLPAPATPKRAFVSPKGSWKETPRRTALSSKERCTSSNTMAETEDRSAQSGMSGSGGVDMRSLVRQDRNQKLGHKEVRHQNKHRSGHHRLCCGAAHALRAAACSHAVVAADGRNDEAEQSRLQQAHEYVLQHQHFPGVAPVLAGVEGEKKLGDHESTG